MSGTDLLALWHITLVSIIGTIILVNISLSQVTAAHLKMDNLKADWTSNGCVVPMGPDTPNNITVIGESSNALLHSS